MKYTKGLWKDKGHMNVLLYEDRGYYCSEDFSFAVKHLATGGGLRRGCMEKSPEYLILPSQFIFNA